MKIIDKIRGSLDRRKFLKQGMQLINLKKSIDTMTMKEIAIELYTITAELNKEENSDSIKLLKEREEELIKYSLSLRHGYVTDNLIFFLVNNIKDRDKKAEYLARYSKYFSDDELEKLISYKVRDAITDNTNFSDAKLKREEQLNNLKNRARKILSIFIPQNKKLDILIPKQDEHKRIEEEKAKFTEKIKFIIAGQNYERINLYDFLKNQNVHGFLNSIKYFPEEIRTYYILEYVGYKNNPYWSEDKLEEIKSVLKSEVPEEYLKESILNDPIKFSNILGIVEMSFNDVQRFYRKNGTFPDFYTIYDLFQSRFNSYEQIQNEFQYFRNDEEKNKFLKYCLYDLKDFNERKKILEDDIVNVNIKLQIINSELYNKKDEDKVQFLEDLLTVIKEEKVINTVNILLGIQKGELDKSFELMKSNNYFEYLIGESLLLKYSDDKLKELYTSTQNQNLKAIMLTLSRRKIENSFFGEELTEEEKEQNKKLPRYIIINEKNFYEIFNNATSIKEIEYLFSFECRDYLKNLSFEQLLDLNEKVNIIILKNHNNRIYKGAITEALAEKLDLKNFIKLANTKITNDEFLSFCYKLDFEEITKGENIKKLLVNVKNFKIKNSIISKINNYTHYLIENQEREIKREKLIKKYNELLEDNDISIKDKYLLFSKIMGSYNVSNIDGDDFKAFCNEIVPKFKKFNIDNGREEYNKIFDFTPQFKYSELLRCDVNCVDFLNMINCIAYLESDVVYEKLTKLYESNSNVSHKINPALLDEDIIGILNENILDFWSRYGNGSSDFYKIAEDELKTKIFIKISENLQKLKAYSEEDELLIAQFLENIDIRNIEEIENLPEEKIIEYTAIATSKTLKKKYEEYLNEKRKSNNSENYSFTEFIKKDTLNELNSKILTRKQALDALGTRFFGISYEEMKKYVSEYSHDLDLMLEKYNSKQELTEEEENELYSLKILRNIKEILAIKDKKSIVETYMELDKLEEFKDIDFSLPIALDENLRRCFAKDYKESLYNFNEINKKETIDGVNIYSPKEFNLLVHVVAAFGKFNLIDNEKSAKEIWNAANRKENHILCTSYISNSNLCFARPMENEKKIILGFKNFNENSVLMGAPYDIGSATEDFSSDKSAYLSSFRMAKNMPKHTKWSHNEICLERRIIDNKRNNIEPDYIVCIDEVDEDSLKVAKDFNIPIVLMETKEIAKKESKKIDELFDKFYKEKNSKYLSEIVNRYQTNLCSYKNYKSDILNEYFSQENMKKKINELISSIDKMYNVGNRKIALECYEELFNAIQLEIDMYLESGIEPDEVNDKLKLREFQSILKNKIQKFNKKDTKKAKETREGKVKYSKVIERKDNEYARGN